MRKNVLIFGAGAVGCLVGGLLAHAGHRVVFVGRKRIVQSLRRDGLIISGVWGDWRVRRSLEAFESTKEMDKGGLWDWVLVTTKSYDTPVVTDAIRPLLPATRFCISLQNGLGNMETISKAAGWEKTLGGRVITGVEVEEPGKVRVTVHADDIRLGHLQNRVPLCEIEEIAQLWREAGIPTSATDRLEGYIWAKVLYNAALNPLGALLGATYA